MQARCLLVADGMLPAEALLVICVVVHALVDSVLLYAICGLPQDCLSPCPETFGNIFSSGSMSNTSTIIGLRFMQ